MDVLLNYTIAMEGRQVGGVVIEGNRGSRWRNGGVYDWMGRTDNTEFIGYLPSAGYTGVFSVTRAK